MAAFLFASIGFRILRRTWLYALLAIASYQLGADSTARPHANALRSSVLMPSHTPSRGYINAPGFHFNY